MSRTPKFEGFDPVEEEDLDEKEEDQKRPRTKWGTIETADLVDGCYEHGVGAWKKILNDPKYHFHSRTPVDLKDRFRTIYPQEYKRLYPDTLRVHTPKKPLESQPPPFDRIKRRQRRPFTKKEDEQLWLGVKKHGVAWSKISRDSEFDLSHRRSTDLRDRYRNAFPDEYEALGYSTRSVKKKKSSGNPPNTSSSEPDDVPQMSEDIIDPGLALEAVIHSGADESEQHMFWEGPSSSVSQPHRQDSQEAGYETSVPISRHVETQINSLVATPVFVKPRFNKFSFGQRSPSSRQAPTSLANADQMMVTPAITRIVGARIKSGQLQYKVRFRASWASGDELPQGSEPSLTEFFNVLSESVSPIRVPRTA